MSYRVSFERALGWVIEVRQSDLPDREAIVLETEDDIQHLLDELRFAFENSQPNLVQ